MVDESVYDGSDTPEIKNQKRVLKINNKSTNLRVACIEESQINFEVWKLTIREETICTTFNQINIRAFQTPPLDPPQTKGCRSNYINSEG